MGNSRRLQKHRQRGMNRRMRGNKRSMSKEQKEALLIMKKKGIKVIVYPRTKGVSTTKIEKELR